MSTQHKRTSVPGLFNSFLGELRFDKVCGSKNLVLFKQFNVPIWERGPWSIPTTPTSSVVCVED